MDRVLEKHLSLKNGQLTLPSRNPFLEVKSSERKNSFYLNPILSFQSESQSWDNSMPLPQEKQCATNNLAELILHSVALRSSVTSLEVSSSALVVSCCYMLPMITNLARISSDTQSSLSASYSLPS